MGTRLWQAQDALVTALRGTLTGGVPITLGAPADKQQTHVWVSGDVDQWEQNFRTSGLGAKDESFVLQVEALVMRNSSDYATPRARMQTLIDEIEQAVSADHTLGGSVMLAQIERITMDEGVTDERQRAIGCTVFVRCEAFRTT